MPRNTIKDSALLTAFVKKGHADTILVHPNKLGQFAFSKANRYFIGKLDPKARNSVKVYAKSYANKGEAFDFLRAKRPAPPIPQGTAPDVAAIIRFCSQEDARVSSHLHGEYFVVSKTTPKGERRWFEARVKDGKVKVSDKAMGSRGAAVVHVERKGGFKPSKALNEAPSYPSQLYFTG
jgi:hypothetical protein